jgi:hypothetical protein
MDDFWNVYADPMALADFRLDELRDSFPCFTCGSLMPSIIEGRFCSDCTGENRQGFLDTRVVRLAREAGAVA